MNYVVAPEDLLTKAKAVLELINSKAPLAVTKCIACVNAVFDENVNGFVVEVAAFGECFETEDKVEGTTAFIEKRKPIFKGK